MPSYTDRELDREQVAAEAAHARAAEARQRLHPSDPARPDDPECEVCGGTMLLGDIACACAPSPWAHGGVS